MFLNWSYGWTVPLILVVAVLLTLCLIRVDMVWWALFLVVFFNVFVVFTGLHFTIGCVKRRRYAHFMANPSEFATWLSVDAVYFDRTLYWFGTGSTSGFDKYTFVDCELEEFDDGVCLRLDYLLNPRKPTTKTTLRVPYPMEMAGRVQLWRNTILNHLSPIHGHSEGVVGLALRGRSESESQCEGVKVESVEQCEFRG